MKLYQLMKQNKIMNQKDIANVLKYASHDLPYLANEIQRLRDDVVDLEYKKRDLKDVLTLECSVI